MKHFSVSRLLAILALSVAFLIPAISVGKANSGGPPDYPAPYDAVVAELENPKPNKLSEFGSIVAVVYDNVYVSAKVDKTDGVVFYKYRADKLSKKRRVVKNDYIGLHIYQTLDALNYNPEVYTSNYGVFGRPYDPYFGPESIVAAGWVYLYVYEPFYEQYKAFANPSLFVDPVVKNNPELATESYFGNSVAAYGDELIFVGHPGYRQREGESPGKVWVISLVES